MEYFFRENKENYFVHADYLLLSALNSHWVSSAFLSSIQFHTPNPILTLKDKWKVLTFSFWIVQIWKESFSLLFFFTVVTLMTYKGHYSFHCIRCIFVIRNINIVEVVFYFFIILLLEYILTLIDSFLF